MPVLHGLGLAREVLLIGTAALKRRVVTCLCNHGRLTKQHSSDM